MDRDKTVFLKVIKMHQGIINSLCHVYYRLEEDRRDTRQDIILQLWRSFDTFRNECSISTWIYKVSLNTILSKIRKEKRSVPKESLSDAHEGITVAADDTLQQLMQVIHYLEGTDKAIVILHLEGYSHKETGSMLGFTETNISTRLNRIKVKLRELYNIKDHELK